MIGRRMGRVREGILRQLTTAVRNRNEYEQAKARVYLEYIKPHIEEDLGEW